MRRYSITLLLFLWFAHLFGNDGIPNPRLFFKKVYFPVVETPAVFTSKVHGKELLVFIEYSDSLNVKGHYMTRYGQYLGVQEPSGSLECIQAAPGTMTEADMKKAPYIECASLSGLQLDLYNDYIGGEIRLAYYFDGEKTVPVTGITMSGKLSQVLSSLRLSQAVCVEGEYQGPRRLLMPGISVL